MKLKKALNLVGFLGVILVVSGELAYGASPGGGSAATAKATFAGGCFWCMEPPFDKLDGVSSTISGYAGGKKKNPTYEEVSAGNTGHTEVVEPDTRIALAGSHAAIVIDWHDGSLS